MNTLQENLSPSSCLQFLVLSSHFEESWQFVENPVCTSDEREGGFISGQELEEGEQPMGPEGLRT